MNAVVYDLEDEYFGGMSQEFKAGLNYPKVQPHGYCIAAAHGV